MMTTGGIENVCDQAPGYPIARDETVLLLQTAQAGDEQAFTALVRQFEPHVYRTALALMGQPGLAEDAAQEVLIRFFRFIHRVDAEREPGPWFYRVTVNVCRSMLRKERRRHWLALAWRREAETAAAPACGLQTEELRSQLLQGLQTLSSREREVLVLRDLESMEIGEVAGMLGIVEGTVRSLLSRGRRKLHAFRKTALEQES
jgi:RNA polymerase sigma-70 factor, ECF subfamily